MTYYVKKNDNNRHDRITKSRIMRPEMQRSNFLKEKVKSFSTFFSKDNNARLKFKGTELVMGSGSKSRVRVGFEYCFSGSGRVQVYTFGFLSGSGNPSRVWVGSGL